MSMFTKSRSTCFASNELKNEQQISPFKLDTLKHVALRIYDIMEDTINAAIENPLELMNQAK